MIRPRLKTDSVNKRYLLGEYKKDSNDHPRLSINNKKNEKENEPGTHRGLR
jgi:hypothetical protein